MPFSSHSKSAQTAEAETPVPPSANVHTRADRGRWLGVAAVAVVILACMVNGRSATAMTLLAGFTGLGLLLCPPRWKIPLPLLAAAGLILLVGGLTLLPANWLNLHPAWHEGLAVTWGLELPTSGTRQPDLTLGAWLTTAIGCGWFFLLLGNSPGESGRRLILRSLTGGALIIAALAVATKLQLIALNWPVGYPAGGVDLGPFPNRNHFAGLCAIGAILSAALSYDAFRRSPLVWLLFGGGFLLFTVGIIFNTSRAGIGLLFIGLILWVSTGSMSKDFLKRIAIAASIMLAAIAVLAFQKEGIGARLFDPDTGWFAQVSQDEGRSSIQRETARQMLDAPLTGVGLGQFDSVFGLVHQLPEHHLRFTHPESDWLWWLFEAGFLVAVAVGIALGWLIKSHRRKGRRHPASAKDEAHLRLRLAALIGVGLALLHGIVDVPLHNAGLAFLALLLAAQTVAPKRLDAPAGPLYRLTFRLAGGAILGLSVLLALTAMGQPRYPGRMRLDAERLITQALAENGRYREALERVSAQLQRTPLQWDLFYQAATLRLALRQPAAEALADFNRARALEPRNLNLCYEEGKTWLRHQPSLAIIPWHEFFNRQSGRSHHYQMMFAEAQGHPEVLQALRRLALTSSMKLTALAHTPPGNEWQSLLASLLESDPDLEELDPTERLHLFHHWQSRGDRAQLVTAIESHPEWQAHAWQLLADEYAQAAHFEKAWAVQKKFGLTQNQQAEPSASQSDVEQLERSYLLNPNDLRRGVDLFFALKTSNRQAEAFRLVEKLIALPNSPAFLQQELAVLHAENGDFKQAYETLKVALSNRS